MAWQRLRHASYCRWREAAAALLCLTSLGMGLGPIAVARLLEEQAVAEADNGSQAAGSWLAQALLVAAATARHAALLLFASGSAVIASLLLSLRMRVR